MGEGVEVKLEHSRGMGATKIKQVRTMGVGESKFCVFCENVIIECPIWCTVFSKRKLLQELSYSGFPRISTSVNFFFRINHTPLVIMDGWKECCEMNAMSLDRFKRSCKISTLSSNLENTRSLPSENYDGATQTYSWRCYFEIAILLT